MAATADYASGSIRPTGLKLFGAAAVSTHLCEGERFCRRLADPAAASVIQTTRFAVFDMQTVAVAL
jgi:hypothetical protein